ncbi:alpha/beta-hydrolase [Neoconidiobolus thromboides FSU 785]|nr:alpha/beta-hydrolase [Neoconidiobolus thromboides FSU 785]
MVQSILVQDQEPPPLVVVEGFLGSKDRCYWNNFLKCQYKIKGNLVRRVLFVRLGSLSSVHDRCCELYYQLKGGTVDFGEEHSLQMGHKRYGRTYPGLYPKWSDKYPLHILGHSLGGLTCVRFQRMLADCYFDTATSENWIKSVTTFSTPHRGSTLPYTIGASEINPIDVNPFSVGAFLYRFAYIISWFGFQNIDLQLDHWELYKYPFWQFLYNLIFRFQFDKGFDNAASDLTLSFCENYNQKYSKEFKSTYYRSYSASMSYKVNQYYYPILNWSRPFRTILFSMILGTYSFKAKDKVDEEWRDNDGVIPVISQYHPKSCKDQNCIHLKYKKAEKILYQPLFSQIQPGIWYTIEIEDACHFNVIRSKNKISKEHQVLLMDIWVYLNQIDTNTKIQKVKKIPKELKVSFSAFNNIHLLSPLNSGLSPAFYSPLLSPLVNPIVSPISTC